MPAPADDSLCRSMPEQSTRPAGGNPSEDDRRGGDILPDGRHPPNVEYTPVQLALARAFRWQKMIDEGKFSNIKDLAATIGVDSGHISRTIRLTLLSPKIIHKLLSGELDLSWDSCRRSFPDSWAEQEKMFHD